MGAITAFNGQDRLPWTAVPRGGSEIAVRDRQVNGRFGVGNGEKGRGIAADPALPG